MEENDESEELSEAEEKHHEINVFLKNTFLKKRRAKKSFTCTQCGKSLTSKHSLENHMRIHTGERPFTCNQCGKSFTCKRNLKLHLRVHTGKKLFTCKQCGKSFMQPHTLRDT